MAEKQRETELLTGQKQHSWLDNVADIIFDSAKDNPTTCLCVKETEVYRVDGVPILEIDREEGCLRLLDGWTGLNSSVKTQIQEIITREFGGGAIDTGSNGE